MDIWKEKPKPVWVPRRYCSNTKIKEDDIQMLILQEADAWLKKLKAEWDVLTQAIELKDKIESPNVVILPREKYDELLEKLEAVKGFILGRQSDIEGDIENFGALKPVLSYFLESEKVKS